MEQPQPLWIHNVQGTVPQRGTMGEQKLKFISFILFEIIYKSKVVICVTLYEQIAKANCSSSVLAHYSQHQCQGWLLQNFFCSDHSSKVTQYCPVTPIRLQLGTNGELSRELTALKFLLHLGSTWGIFLFISTYPTG